MYNYIQGGVSKDERGQIRFVNDFDMSRVKRFYIIKNGNLELVRGWRAHRVEQRWFYALSGSFKLDLVKIDSWDHPNRELDIIQLTLNSRNHEILHVPPGYGVAFQSLEDDSEVLVFADYHLGHSNLDDYTYSLDYFVKKSE